MAVHRKLSLATRLRLEQEARQAAARALADRINAAAMRLAEDPGITVQGMGTGWHWTRPKFQRTTPKRANNPQGRRAHPRTNKLQRRTDGFRRRDEELHEEVRQILDGS